MKTKRKKLAFFASKKKTLKTVDLSNWCANFANVARGLTNSLRATGILYQKFVSQLMLQGVSAPMEAFEAGFPGLTPRHPESISPAELKQMFLHTLEEINNPAARPKFVQGGIISGAWIDEYSEIPKQLLQSDWGPFRARFGNPESEDSLQARKEYFIRNRPGNVRLRESINELFEAGEYRIDPPCSELIEELKNLKFRDAIAQVTSDELSVHPKNWAFVPNAPNLLADVIKEKRRGEREQQILKGLRDPGEVGRAHQQSGRVHSISFDVDSKTAEAWRKACAVQPDPIVYAEFSDGRVRELSPIEVALMFGNGYTDVRKLLQTQPDPEAGLKLHLTVPNQGIEHVSREEIERIRIAAHQRMNGRD